MGEARRRGANEMTPRGKPKRWSSIWPLKAVKAKDRQRSNVPKRVRGRRRRALRLKLGLTRREMGAILVGQREPPLGFELAFNRAGTDPVTPKPTQHDGDHKRMLARLREGWALDARRKAKRAAQALRLRLANPRAWP